MKRYDMQVSNLFEVGSNKWLQLLLIHSRPYTNKTNNQLKLQRVSSIGLTSKKVTWDLRNMADQQTTFFQVVVDLSGDLDNTLNSQTIDRIDKNIR